MKELAAFQEFLKARGLKLTSQRNVIARRVLGTPHHFSAEELLDELRGGGKRRRISKATVYRTLALLEESSLISALDLQRGHRFYEPNDLRGHAHLVCVECFKVVELTDPDLEALHDRIARRHGFSAASHAHKLFGVCAACAERAGAGGAAGAAEIGSRSPARAPRAAGMAD